MYPPQKPQQLYLYTKYGVRYPVVIIREEPNEYEYGITSDDVLVETYPKTGIKYYYGWVKRSELVRVGIVD